MSDIKVTPSNSIEAYGLHILNSRHPEIQRLKKQYHAEIHGNKFWGSSYLLMDYFTQNPLDKQLKVLEAGCGWGLSGIFLARQYQAQVSGLDADDNVFPYLQLHAKVNQVDIRCWKKRYEKITKAELAEFDVLIGADICFWDEMSDILFKLVRKALNAGVSKIVLADPGRPPFIEMAERCEEEFYGEFFNYKITQPKKAKGCLLLIENA